VTEEQIRDIMARVLAEREAKFRAEIRDTVMRYVNKRVDERLQRYTFNVETAITEMLIRGEMRVGILPQEEP
jgi:hypothetical protein